MILHLIRDYDNLENFGSDEFFVPHNMYSEDDRGHDGLLWILLNKLQQFIPKKKVEYLLALLKDLSCPFIFQRDHSKVFAFLYPLFISPILELPSIFQLVDPIIMYSKSNISEFYLNTEIYCIKDHGPSICDEVNTNSLEELKGLFLPMY